MEFPITDVSVMMGLLKDLVQELPDGMRPPKDTKPNATEVLTSVLNYVVEEKKRKIHETSPMEATKVKAEPGLEVDDPADSPLPPPPQIVDPKAAQQPKFVQNETTKVQSIYLPPGGKLINVPGVGQTICIPAELPRMPITTNATPTIVQLPPGAKVAITQEQKKVSQSRSLSFSTQPPPNTSLPSSSSTLSSLTTATQARPARPMVSLSSSGLVQTQVMTTAGPRLVMAPRAAVPNVLGSQPMTIMTRDKNGVAKPVTIIPTSGGARPQAPGTIVATAPQMSVAGNNPESGGPLRIEGARSLNPMTVNLQMGAVKRPTTATRTSSKPVRLVVFKPHLYCKTRQ